MSDGAKVGMKAVHDLSVTEAELANVHTPTDDEILGYNEWGLFDEEGDFSLTDVEIA